MGQLNAVVVLVGSETAQVRATHGRVDHSRLVRTKRYLGYLEALQLLEHEVRGGGADLSEGRVVAVQDIYTWTRVHPEESSA